MIHDLLNNKILGYILLGMFHTDNLESRFVQDALWMQLSYLGAGSFLSKFSEIKKSKRDVAFSQSPLFSIPNPCFVDGNWICSKVNNICCISCKKMFGSREIESLNLDYFIHHLVPCDVCGCEVVTHVMRSLN